MDKISVKIPANSRYLKSVRLLVAGIGSDLGFDIEQIEDLKVIISEAINYKLGMDDIEIKLLVDKSKLNIKVLGKDTTSDIRMLNMRDSILKALANNVKIEDDFISISVG